VNPPTHQDSQKVPWEVVRLKRCSRCGTTDPVLRHSSCPENHGPRGIHGESKTETYVPISALLSDEVVEAVARVHYERQRVPKGFAWTWDDHPGEGIKQNRRSLAKLDLQAAIEQVGGGE
jgi:hypothetical protein